VIFTPKGKENINNNNNIRRCGLSAELTSQLQVIHNVKPVKPTKQRLSQALQKMKNRQHMWRQNLRQKKNETQIAVTQVQNMQ